MHVYPCAGVVILNAFVLPAHGDVGVPTKDALSFALFCVTERAASYLRRQAQPSCVETVKVAGETFALEINLLKMQVNELSDLAQHQIVDGETIELVSVDRNMPFALKFPHILLVDRYANQVRHDF